MSSDSTANRRGSSKSRSNPIARAVGKMMINIHRRAGDKFMGMNLLYLTTIGARSGQERTAALARFPDDDGWLIVASNGGAGRNPGWYHNIAAHPDQIWIEMAGKRMRATAEELSGERRDDAWRQITATQPRYAGYERKTTRVIPVIRMTSVADAEPPATPS